MMRGGASNGAPQRPGRSPRLTSPERRVPGVAEGARRRSWGTVTLAAMLVVASGLAVPAAGDGAGSADEASLDSPPVLTSGANVYSAGGDPSTGSQLLVTLIVNADDAARLAAYSTQNRVALIEIPATPSESDVQ